MPYVKLDTEILNSTLWVERDCREVFITALLMAEPREFLEPLPQIEVDTLQETGFAAPPGWYGFVPSAGIGIINRAGLGRDEGIEALRRLGSADPESRSKEHGGRRMIRIDGGYLVLNFMRYRDKDHTNAERQKRLRDRRKAAQGEPIQVTPVTRDEPKKQPSNALYNGVRSRSISTETNTIQPHTAPPAAPQEEVKPKPRPAPWNPDGQRISPSTIAEEICYRSKWSGDAIQDAIAGQVKLEIRGDTTNAKTAESLAQRMGKAWREYSSKPDLYVIYAVEKFFNQGMWRDVKTWPRKGATGPKANGHVAVGTYDPENTPQAEYTEAEQRELDALTAKHQESGGFTPEEKKRFFELSSRTPTTQPKARPN